MIPDNNSFIINNVSKNVTDEEDDLYPMEWVIPITVMYGIIFVSGIIGNISTCIVIARNKSLHTVTNYYLFSIAISDLLLLLSGLPPEMYRIWSPDTYVFGQAFCVIQGFSAETSANATVLAITAFTVERYLAICHPFLSHTMSNLSRAIKYIIAIWVVALCLAAPQAMQFGLQNEVRNGVVYSQCTVVATDFFQHAFEISTFLIFVGPMTLITVLYILIAIKLGESRVLTGVKRASFGSNATHERISRTAAAQNRVIKMLVAVVVAFFICWAPFHAQRLLAIYLSSASAEAQAMLIGVYIALMHISGVLYFLSTTVNPVLYHIMSHKFREAFKNTFYSTCSSRRQQEYRKRTYSALSRWPASNRNYQRSVSDGVQLSQQLPLNGTGEGFVKGNNQHQNQARLNKYRARMLSRSSQTTVLTTISNGLGDSEVSKNGNKPQTTNFLDRFPKIFNRKDKQINETNTKHNANTANTISNSSLYDLEASEYNSSDLVQYMKEVNNDLT